MKPPGRAPEARWELSSQPSRTRPATGTNCGAQFTQRSCTCNWRETERRQGGRRFSSMKEGTVQERSPADVLKLVKDSGIEIIDFRFCDLPGLTQHFSAPSHQLTEEVFEEGLGFDGSSIRGFQEIQESDMLLKPDPNTAVIDPFTKHKTLNINCFVRDPVTGEAYSRDPRYIAK